MAKSKDYKERFYRKWASALGLVSYEVMVDETDLFISSEKDLKLIAEKSVKRYRMEIQNYMALYPQFKTSLQPLNPDPGSTGIVEDMLKVSRLAGVGPMASVAGAIAEYVGKELLRYSPQVIIENGGDIFLASEIERNVAIFAGDSPLTNKLSIKVRPEDTPLGICSSSGTVGHSLSFGKADACVIISKSTSLADAVATATCNRVKAKEDIPAALEFALAINNIKAAIIVWRDTVGVLGDTELN